MGSLGIIHDAPPIATQVSGHGYMDDLTTERSFDSQAEWVIDVLGFFTLSKGICTGRHWQTTGRLVQEVNVCTVAANWSIRLLNWTILAF